MKPVIAFVKRAWIQQRSTALWMAALLGAVFGILAVSGVGNVAQLGDVPDLILGDTNALVSVTNATGQTEAMVSYMLLMAPAILGALVAIVATLTLPGVVADDIAAGGIEVLLASPIPRRKLFGAYLGASLILTAASWILATTAFCVATAISVVAQDFTIAAHGSYIAALILLPLAMGVWSASITLFGALLYPASLESQNGMNGGPIRLLAMAPALLAVPSVLLLSDWLLPIIAAITIAVLLATVLIVWLTSKGFQSTRVLG